MVQTQRPNRHGVGARRGATMTTVTHELFPHTPRVLYANAPLVQVTCQLQFPAILRIEKDAPAEFQDRIRHAFPLFERINPFPAQLPPQILQAIGQGAGPPTAYHFLSEDRRQTVELTPQSLGLTTQSYVVWERFISQINYMLSALVDVYAPSFFTRVGLRYQDLIERSKIGKTGVPWSRLLKPQILGELTMREIEENVQGVSRVLHVRMPSGAGTVLLRHGFGTVQGRTEVGYVIDFDFYTEEKTEVPNVQSVLTRLHEEVGRAFRWCIQPELHDALGPSELDHNKLDAIDPG